VPGLAATVLVGAGALGCVDATSVEPVEDDEASLAVRVTVDFEAERAVVPRHAWGMHASVYDNALHDPRLPELLEAGGVSLLRYPGGGYSDNYHWSTHTMTPFGNSGNRGYLAEGSDFGSFVSVIESFGGTAMITVNYGSNLAGDGPGDPEEAAAWVAYANGLPEDEHPIGVDASGTDWGTVGDWATLRASAPLDDDDGRNFLRIEHPAPLGLHYWEIGNELFGNGYYGEANEYEHDGHVPYDGTPREHHPLLSGSTYGAGVVAYAEAMKAVDPTIAIGAVLNTPPRDYSWGPDWNADVLEECGEIVDFVIVHWYPTTEASTIVAVAGTELAEITAELRASLQRHGGENAERIELAMTELGGGPGHHLLQDAPQSLGLFANDTYLTAVELGFANLDWLELHNGTYLSERDPAPGPAYYGIQLAAALAQPGDTLVEASSDRTTVAAHAARGADGRHGILLMNRRVPRTPPAEVTIDVSGADLPTECGRVVLATSALNELGAIEDAEPVAVVDGSLTVTLEGYSIALLTCASTE
jgi:hypothetical protein